MAKIFVLTLCVMAAVATATGPCQKDGDCQTDGDMSAYCKDNNDCHCSAPHFNNADDTCKLACSPVSSPTIGSVAYIVLQMRKRIICVCVVIRAMPATLAAVMTLIAKPMATLVVTARRCVVTTLAMDSAVVMPAFLAKPAARSLL